MQNLRIISVNVIDSSHINIKFTATLTNNLVTSNMSIISDTNNVPDSEVLGLVVNSDTISVVCQPLTQLASYIIKFQSIDSHQFISLNGDAKLFEDGVSNQYIIVGPMEPNNIILDYFKSYFKDNIYTDDDQAIISKYIKSLSIIISRALNDIRQTKNENYLSFDIIDEQHTRGAGPFDRLYEESAYNVSRVGRTLTASNVSLTLSHDVFPSYPITLQKHVNTETLYAGSTDDLGTFNINTLILNFNNEPVTRINSIIFTFLSENAVYNYDIESMGYQLKDSKYAQDFGFSYISLGDNQVKISDKVLDDPNFLINNIFKIDVEYETKDLGRVIDNNSVTLYTSLNSIREVLPPIINVFNLKHAPIVDSNNEIPTLGGISFIDPNNTIGSKHPAFINEIPFRLNSLPVLPGQYSIDYNTGTVYVYGSDLNNDGTGPFPPLATYKYRFTYINDQDYTFDSSSLDVVALPKGNLINTSGTILFDYEQVLIPGKDYNAGLHEEALNERVNNKLLALNVLKTENSPITNVFRIFNETSGEIYTLDRWNDNKIYFKYNNPPNIKQQILERVNFKNIVNELLCVNADMLNGSAIRIFKIPLRNNTIASSTEDSLGSSFNSSATFSKTEIFSIEKWHNRTEDEESNVNRLTSIGEYTIDYTNGIVYCAVSNSQDFSIGTITYKNNIISLQNPHIISVDDIYYRINILDPKNKQFTYTLFDDGFIEPEVLDYSDELFLNDMDIAPYQLYNNSIGVFDSATFIEGVTNQVKFVRSIYEYEDLSYNTNPLNFAQYSSSSGFNITVDSINKQLYDNVYFDGSDYYVLINENIPYLSSNITYDFSVTRLSDSASLWNNSGTIVTGNPLKLILPNINSPVDGDAVSITYTFTINNLSRIIVDYNKGDYFVDYAYLADEILVSYEYGDNVIDFRQNKTLPEGTTYYVTYKAGALRDALLRNFGTLVNVPGLSDIDLEFERERYRDALIAALTSFIKGPTLSAIKSIGKTISHIEPEVIESIFQNWSLGNSLLNPAPITTTGEFQLLPGKFNNGALLNSNQTITMPSNSNIRFEEGTFETWINPQWNGIDNDAELTFNILQDGYVIDGNKVFVGSAEYHPIISDGLFSVNKNSNVFGAPNKNKDGVYVYYHDDSSGSFKRWFVEILDGYVSGPSTKYEIKIISNGSFYDTKSITLPKPANITMFTGNNNVKFTLTTSGATDEGFTFISDIEHYILDVGMETGKNRLSIYKNISGYMNFRVIDKNKNPFSVAADVSSWTEGELHHVAASWKLNTKNNKDEMHLFLDGFEVPNIIKYGQKLRPYLHEKFNTVNPEEIIGLIDKDIVSSIDLHTNSGTASVSSSINFSSYNINPGDKIFIDETGFSSSGYTILSINGQTLTLTENMPLTLSDARFSVNRTDFTVTSDINTVPNIAVTTISYMLTGDDINGAISSDTLTSSIDFSAQNVEPGYLIKIDDNSIDIVYTILQVSGTTLTINDNLPSNIVNKTFRIYTNIENEIPGIRAVLPSYSISKDVDFNNILTISNSVKTGDLILIRTLGLNNKRVRKNYYIWSDSQENILMTRLPAPISLDEVKITKIILPSTVINSNNSTISLGRLTSNNLNAVQTSESFFGRTLNIILSGTNIDFSASVDVTIDGYIAGNILTNEVVSFSDYGVLDSVNQYLLINSVTVAVTPININKDAALIIIKEKHPITKGESSAFVPIIRYSYETNSGTTLYLDGYASVRDDNNIFSGSDIGNYIVISSPITVAGFYIITGISQDRKSLTLQSTLTSYQMPIVSFTNGYYKIMNVSQYRSGLQNGFFTFENSAMPGQAYFLDHGFYELDYCTYASIHLDPINSPIYFGSNFAGTNQLNGIIDQVKIYSVMLTDTRIGETIPSIQKSITKDFNSLKPLIKDSTTLSLIDFNSYPFTNMADFYINSNMEDTKNHFQSSIVVNSNFGNSLAFLQDPIVLSNNGILNTRKEGTIEFWVNPLFDTANDPNSRFYFDAYGAVIENTVSTDNVSVKISTPASQIISVKINGDDSDYFSGGKLEIDTQKAIQETITSTSNSVVSVTQPILQVITVKIANDLTGIDYFSNGSISSDKMTIYLGKLLPSSTVSVIVTYQTTNNNNDTYNTQIIRLNKKLPYQKTKVIVNYIPKGLQGDRLSIFKDQLGYINFAINASNHNYVVCAETRWAANTWHRIKASYRLNNNLGLDEMRLFLDGYEYSEVFTGSGLIFGKYPTIVDPTVSFDGYAIGSIKFKDPINNLFIGSQYTYENPIFSLVDNFRISNISRPIYAPYGESLDVNYSTNLDMVFPVTSDLYTTYLLDFNTFRILNEDFTVIKNRNTGLFDFSVNIFDSLGIINSSIKSKEALETLIKILKPANSRVFISYI
ncbi:hypothetical protein UFOVP1290_27 [uncultured Caudovirales phage]|uniref:Uncharacterized protein n=1 Tax=uncultured Caudovirales phage TaxID=2100421 RepID=A0A6J5RQF0_9CAUD|nr:hypothetical protein UFOVP1290_27 [uncultured Caudovirales phage]